MKDVKNLPRTKILLSFPVVLLYCFDVRFFFVLCLFVFIFVQVFGLSSFPSSTISVLLSLLVSSFPPSGTRMTLPRVHVAVGSVGWMEMCPHLPDGGPRGRNKEAGALIYFSLEGEMGWGTTEQSW